MRSISRKIRDSLVVPAIIGLMAMAPAPVVAQTAPTDKDAVECPSPVKLVHYF